MSSFTHAEAPHSPRRGRQPATPRARRAMADLGLDVSAVRGSGPRGRIVEADVLKVGPNAAPILGAATVPPGAIVVPLSEMRRAIARRTAESFATVPHFYLRTEVDAGPLLAMRAELVAEAHRLHDVRPTLTDFLLGALAVALVKCPFANRIWHGDRLLEFATADVALQVAVDDGILAPVIRGAHGLGLIDLARQRSRLVAACRAGKLPADALGAAACSLSNLGVSRLDEFAAIIMPPQSSILAVGRAAPRPWVADGALCVRTTMRLCLSVDHRVMDGLAAARFLAVIVDSLENPSQLLSGVA